MKQFITTFLIVHFFFIHYIQVQAQRFALEDIKSNPFPSNLTSSANGAQLAWAVNEQGKRNIYVAQGPDFAPRKLTNYNQDDGQEITSLSISDNGQWVVYVRGGDHGSNWDEAIPVNAIFSPVPPKVQIWSVPFLGGEPKALAEGDEPAISPDNNNVAFIKNGQVWVTALDASSQAINLFTSRGTNNALAWSPDGSQLAFVSNRGDHALVGVYTNSETAINWIAPSFSRDRTPRWSPDGKKLVFVRTSGGGGVPDSVLVRKHQPWAIWTAEVASGKATQLWKAPETLAG